MKIQNCLLSSKGNVRSLIFTLIVLLVSFACKKEEFIPVDYCPTCTSSIELNDVAWPSYPTWARFQVSTSLDTTFNIEIEESDPPSTYVIGYLHIRNIPYHVVEYKNDSLLQKDLHNHIYFIVWNDDTPYQNYQSPFNASNMISVVSINKSTGAFELSFDLTFIADGAPPNSPYPEVAHFKGTAQGIVTSQ